MSKIDKERLKNIALLSTLSAMIDDFDHPFGNFIIGLISGIRFALGENMKEDVIKFVENNETSNDEVLDCGIYFYKKYKELKSELWDSKPAEYKKGAREAIEIIAKLSGLSWEELIKLQEEQNEEVKKG